MSTANFFLTQKPIRFLLLVLTLVLCLWRSSDGGRIGSVENRENFKPKNGTGRLFQCRSMYFKCRDEKKKTLGIICTIFHSPFGDNRCYVQGGVEQVIWDCIHERGFTGTKSAVLSEFDC